MKRLIAGIAVLMFSSLVTNARTAEGPVDAPRSMSQMNMNQMCGHFARCEYHHSKHERRYRDHVHSHAGKYRGP